MFAEYSRKCYENALEDARSSFGEEEEVEILKKAKVKEGVKEVKVGEKEGVKEVEVKEGVKEVKEGVKDHEKAKAKFMLMKGARIRVRKKNNPHSTALALSAAHSIRGNIKKWVERRLKIVPRREDPSSAIAEEVRSACVVEIHFVLIRNCFHGEFIVFTPSLSCTKIPKDPTAVSSDEKRIKWVLKALSVLRHPGKAPPPIDDNSGKRT